MSNSRDWIDVIVEETWENFAGRKVVLWGKYGASEQIKEILKKRYGIETAFYVDKDPAKIDNRIVYSTGFLGGKSSEYYVVVPVAYYQTLKDELIKGGILKRKTIVTFAIAS